MFDNDGLLLGHRPIERCDNKDRKHQSNMDIIICHALAHTAGSRADRQENKQRGPVSDCQRSIEYNKQIQCFGC